MPPADLVEWQEIKTLDKMVTVVATEWNAFEGWEDKEDGGVLSSTKLCQITRQKFNN